MDVQWRGTIVSMPKGEFLAPSQLVMHLSILGPTTPHTGHRWGLVGIIRDLHVNFDPRGGAFDLSPHNLYWSLGSLWENQKEAEWLPSLEEGKRLKVVMSSEGRKFAQLFLKVAT